MTAMHDLRFVTAAELEEIRARGGPVVVAFVATWNPRCLAFANDLRLFAEQWSATLPTVCVDVDECSSLTAAFDVCSIPTILLFRSGVEAHREVGLDLQRVSAWLGDCAAA